MAILEVDDEKLNSNLLGQLLTALPPSEMIDQLREYCKANGDTKNLPEGEQVLISYNCRLQCLNLDF